MPATNSTIAIAARYLVAKAGICFGSDFKPAGPNQKMNYEIKIVHFNL